MKSFVLTFDDCSWVWDPNSKRWNGNGPGCFDWQIEGEPPDNVTVFSRAGYQAVFTLSQFEFSDVRFGDVGHERLTAL